MDFNALCWEEEKVSIPKGVPTFDWDDYKCVKELGRSGKGFSYKVQQISTGEFFAIKKVTISSDEVHDQDHKDRIMFDMILATSIDHPNIMKCLGVCMNQCGVHFLYNWMPDNLCNLGIIRDESHLAQIAYQVLKGLNYLRNKHRFVFKHLTPGNLLFDPSCSLVKIDDVGTVKDRYISLNWLPIRSCYMKYIAPENFHIEDIDGDEEQDRTLQSDRYTKSDVWSLGLCLLEFYYGTFPFHGNDTELLRYLLSGLDLEYGKLELDEFQRFGVDELLKHDFITTYCAVLSEQGDSSDDDTKISDESIYEYDHLEFPTSSEHDDNIEHHNKKLRLSAETSA
ncbi:serine/threonine protein kinase, CMGC, CDC2/CDK sub [Trifolium repens]|nr:serine/threonine protein kinase, CMGC, CDC2/CDK sub [Trifolium repens]